MPYQPTQFNPGGPPGISAEELNKLGTQYGQVKAELQKTAGAGDIKPDGSNLAITVDPAIAAAYANTGTGNQVPSWFAKALKALKGVAGNWWDDAVDTIQGLSDKVAAALKDYTTEPVARYGSVTAGDVVEMLPDGVRRLVAASPTPLLVTDLSNQQSVVSLYYSSQFFKLNANQFVMAYIGFSAGNPYSLYLRVLNIGNDGALSVGEPALVANDVHFNSYLTFRAAAVGNAVVCAWKTFGANSQKVRAATLSGDVFTFGDPVTVESVALYPQALVAVDGSRFLSAWGTGSTGHLVCCSVSGTTITAGVPTDSIGYGTRIGLCMSGTDEALCIWTDGSYYLKGRNLTLSGTTITLGVVATLVSAAGDWHSIVKVADHRCLLVTVTTADLWRGFAWVVDSNMGAGPAQRYGSATPITLAYNATDFMFGEVTPDGTKVRFMQQAANLGVIASWTFSITLSGFSPVLLSHARLALSPAAYIGRQIVHVTDCLLLGLRGTDKSGSTYLDWFKLHIIESVQPIGIAAESKVYGETCRVVRYGAHTLAGLTPGKNYYGGANGALSLVPSAIPVGVAASATRLLVGVHPDGVRPPVNLGSYYGDSTSRTIEVGFKPKLLLIQSSRLGSDFGNVAGLVTSFDTGIGVTHMAAKNNAYASWHENRIGLTATGFSVTANACNSDAICYTWLAIG